MCTKIKWRESPECKKITADTHFFLSKISRGHFSRSVIFRASLNLKWEEGDAVGVGKKQGERMYTSTQGHIQYQRMTGESQ